MDRRCKFWLPKKNRFCANTPLNDSLFCGNHKPRSEGQWIPCPIDPSHSVLQENLEGHVKRCPLLKQVQSLSLQPFYRKGINAGSEGQETFPLGSSITTNGPNTSISFDHVSSELKRNAVHRMSVSAFCELIEKIRNLHDVLSKDIGESYQMPEACKLWITNGINRKIPFQEKHVLQQASILGNLEDFGVLKTSIVGNECSHGSEVVDKCDPVDAEIPAVVEFGAGRGYLTQMLADCYGIQKVFLVERKSYKLKADRSLRQKKSLILERLRIDIEDLDLNDVHSLQGIPFLAIGKHLCGTATDLTLRCCDPDHINLIGLAIATCCHHLCQWKDYINKQYFSDLGITKEDFHAITWFTSWAVDANHDSNFPDSCDYSFIQGSVEMMDNTGEDIGGVENVIRNMKAPERAVLGFMCKQIIDMGRFMWLKGRGLEAKLVKYVLPSISPENHLLMAKGHGQCIM